MTTPNPSALAVTWSVFIPVILFAVSLISIISGLLYRAVHKRIAEKDAHLRDLVLQLDKRVDAYFTAHERIRDKWEEFMREYLKIDNTRGQKIEALFRVIDQMQKAVEKIPRNLNDKVEEAFTHSLSELKLYVRDTMAKENRDGS